MSQVEILPQSIVNTKTIVMKPRLDQGDIKLIADKIKPLLFGKFIFKPKPEDVRLLGVDAYFEPYLVIGGKYSLDYCRKHVFKVNVKQETTKIFVAGQEFRSEQSEPETTNKTIKMIGEEYAHHERQAYYVLDRLKREVPPEKLPISPFDTQEEDADLGSNFKNMQIADETQIEFLKKKIAQRPTDVAEIIREVFDITERTIVYYPMYQLTFENAKNKKDATVTINGVTGEITLNGIEKIAVKTVITIPEEGKNRPVEVITQKGSQTQTVLNISPTEATDKTVNLKGEDDDTQPIQSVKETFQRAADPKAIFHIDQSETAYNTKKAVTPDGSIQPTQLEAEETKSCRVTQTKTISDSSSMQIKKNNRKSAPIEEEMIQQTQPDAEETMILGFPAKIFGEVFTVGDNVTAVVGDIEVPSGTSINKTLVVKGALRIGDSCRVRGKLKALRNVTVGANTIVNGDVISGGNVLIGPGALVTGRLQAGGYIKIGKHSTIERGLMRDPKTEKVNDIQFEVDTGNTFTSVANET